MRSTYHVANQTRLPSPRECWAFSARGNWINLSNSYLWICEINLCEWLNSRYLIISVWEWCQGNGLPGGSQRSGSITDEIGSLRTNNPGFNRNQHQPWKWIPALDDDVIREQRGKMLDATEQLEDLCEYLRCKSSFPGWLKFGIVSTLEWTEIQGDRRLWSTEEPLALQGMEQRGNWIPCSGHLHSNKRFQGHSWNNNGQLENRQTRRYRRQNEWVWNSWHRRSESCCHHERV